MKKKILLCSIITILILIICFLCNLTLKIDTSNIASEIKYNETIGKPHVYLCGKILFGNFAELSMEDNNINDFSKIGEYTNIYEANFLFYKDRAEKKIKVVDKQAPIIELITKDDYYTQPNRTYEEEGYTAYDEYDGDLTDKVVSKVEGNKVFYTVEDSSGNIATAERTIKYDDRIAPIITLNGDAEITIIKDAEYIERGAIANDDCDGDITGNIKISGTVDTSIVGTYLLVYSVSDNNGNFTEAKRKVVVKENKTTSDDTKTIYLTFDDGPSTHTSELLDTLKKYNVKATFFVVGYKCDEKILKRIVDEGHTVGLHSTNHSYKDIYSSVEAFMKDLYKMQNIVKTTTGIETFLLRFPGGSSNTVSKNYCKGIMSALVKKVEEQGFEYYDWNVSSGDAGGAKTKEQVIKNIKTGVKKYTNSVVLQHDTQKFSVDAVEEIIIWGLENGYDFSELNTESPKAHHGVNN